MGELILLVPVITLVIASVIDLRTREIPDWVTVVLILTAAVAAVFGWADIQWWMVATGLLLGLGVGLGMFFLLGFGGGDARLVAGIGAVLGPAGIWFFLVWMAIAGGLLAIISKLRGSREYAYGPAILAGYIGYLVFPANMWSTLQKLMPGLESTFQNQ